VRQKVAGAQGWPKFCHSISPTKFKPSLWAKICQTLFVVLPICAALNKASHPVRTKKPKVFR